jgi:transcriptional regulator with PAS, ATPase and Fis domain
VLEERKIRRLGSKVETPIDVRVLAATNKSPEQAVADGHLRQDLYFRLNVFHIHLPPLREHKDDLAPLIEHLLAEVSEKHDKRVTGVGTDVMDTFKSYPWPGNVRELRNVLERATIASDRESIGRQHLPSDFGRAPGHHRGRRGARTDRADAGGHQPEQNAGGGTAGNQLEDAAQQAEGIRGGAERCVSA